MPLTRPRFNQFDTTISSISDPITILNKSSTLANIDVGFIFNRDGGTKSNIALFWDESANSFVTSFTTDSGSNNANITITEYANLRVGTLTATFVNATGNISTAQLNAEQINTTGNVSAVELLGRNLTTRSIYGNINLTQYNSIFADGSGLQNIVAIQLSTSGLSDGMGMLGVTGAFGQLYSSRGINFRTGVTVRNTDTPNGGVTLVKITAAGDLWANATTPSTSTTTGALVVAGGVGVGGNIISGGNIMSGGNVTAPYYFGNGSQLSGVITSVTKIINGTSDITAYSGSNIAVTVGGTANTVVFTSSNVHFAGSLIPTANLTFDLGAPTKRWRDAYFSGNTIYLGNAVISSSGTDIFISTTGGFGFPVGTTEQRTDTQGGMRFNTSLNKFEAYDGVSWNSLAYGTLTDFPTGDYGDLTGVTTDAFGVATASSFDCNEEGAITTTDFEVLT